MSGVLVIGPKDARRIRDALIHARSHVIPWSVIEKVCDDDRGAPTAVLTLDQRKPGFERPESEHIMLGTYRACVSFEEQPAGVLKHLSVSSAAEGRAPGPHVMRVVCLAFGFSKEVAAYMGGDDAATVPRASRAWLEEFEPGQYAVNVVEVVE